jgi:hypothetical protein
MCIACSFLLISVSSKPRVLVSSNGRFHRRFPACYGQCWCEMGGGDIRYNECGDGESCVSSIFLCIIMVLTVCFPCDVDCYVRLHHHYNHFSNRTMLRFEVGEAVSVLSHIGALNTLWSCEFNIWPPLIGAMTSHILCSESFSHQKIINVAGGAVQLRRILSHSTT